jgi:hypothetical protein|nr:hypothetical protein [uncultured Romboutsia sp.]DAM61420.1 MAG TPA: hypothetical protein [Caudoviricetes sp.]
MDSLNLALLLSKHVEVNADNKISSITDVGNTFIIDKDSKNNFYIITLINGTLTRNYYLNLFLTTTISDKTAFLHMGSISLLENESNKLDKPINLDSTGIINVETTFPKEGNYELISIICEDNFSKINKEDKKNKFTEIINNKTYISKFSKKIEISYKQ